MRILIDGDGCPVVDITIRIAKGNGVECLILCDTSHYYERDGATTITISKGADAVDFALANMINPGDVAVTQDYGLAAMCLARNAIPINQNGMIFTDDNIDDLLLQRYTVKKIRMSGKRIYGPRLHKRTAEQDIAFTKTLRGLLAR